jgi:hypothetical protein
MLCHESHDNVVSRVLSHYHPDLKFEKYLPYVNQQSLSMQLPRLFNNELGIIGKEKQVNVLQTFLLRF